MWDLIIFIMILYTILITPIYLSFNQNSIYFGWIEIAFELFFILDFFMNFITSFKDVEEYMVTQIREISMNYLMSWFTYDLLYIFPLDFFSFFFSTDIILISSMDYRLNFTLLKWIKILRIAKIFKKQTTGRFVHKIVFNESNTLNRVIKFGCIFFMLSHISSCFFVYIGYSSISNVNWICYAQLSNSNKFDVYIASLYYVLVTIYSVGYGEITPQNYLEILCIIFLLIFGSMIYSYGISSISTMFSERSKKFMEFKRKKVILKSIQDEFNIQPSLFKSIKLVLKHDYKKNETNNSLKEKLELNKLTCKRRRSRSAFSTLAFSNAFTGENDLASPNFIKTLREIRDGQSELQRFIRNVPKLNGNY